MDALVAKMVALHGERILRRSALRVRDGARVLAQLLPRLRPRVIVEIGTYRGCSAAYLAQFCRRVITIDLAHGQLERERAPFDRRAFWRAIGVENIELHLVAGEREKAALIARLDFDLAFIDAAHHFYAVRSDFNLVRHCGRVLFHDYDPACHNDVYRFIRTLRSGSVTVSGIFALWTA